MEQCINITRRRRASKQRKDREPMKSSCIKICGLILSLMLVTGNVLAQQKPPSLVALAQQVADLQEQVRKLQQSNDELRSRLQYVSLVGKDMYITGANLHI